MSCGESPRSCVRALGELRKKKKWRDALDTPQLGHGMAWFKWFKLIARSLCNRILWACGSDKSIKAKNVCLICVMLMSWAVQKCMEDHAGNPPVPGRIFSVVWGIAGWNATSFASVLRWAVSKHHAGLGGCSFCDKQKESRWKSATRLIGLGSDLEREINLLRE